MTNVPFKGNAPALAEVMAGRVTFMFYPIIGIADHVQGGKLKVLAVGTAAAASGLSRGADDGRGGLPRLRGDRAVGRHARPRRHAAARSSIA